MRRRVDRSATALFPPATPKDTLLPGAPYGPEIELWEDGQVVIGTDEAGRGPLAGPVVAAAAAFAPEVVLEGVGDSKVLSARVRDRLFDEIREAALAWAIVEIPPERIDEINILQATREAMDCAVREVAEQLGASWPVVLVDGRIPPLSKGRQLNIVKGDAVSFSIGAASILAKVARDRTMEALDGSYGAYGFRKHKGYPTAEHRAALLQHGPCPIHRRSFTILTGSGERMAIGDLKPNGRTGEAG